MSNYVARLSEPSISDKNFIRFDEGGYNYCIDIVGNSCLPNCVGYAWGRWRELLGEYHYLSTSNAEDWWGNTSDGYSRGQTPKLGAVVCWRKGQAYNENDGCGHVAIVEEIKSNGDIVTSESVYGGARFRTRTYTKASNYYLAQGYVFQGFIYLPLTYQKSKYSLGDYRVTKCRLLKVRAGAGTKYKVKKYSQLTENAQQQVYTLTKKKVNGYPKGTEFTVTEIVDDFWGKTPSGWVSLRWCTKIS